MQQRTRDLHAPHLAIGKVAQLFIGPLEKLSAMERLMRAQPCLPRPYAVQCGVVAEILQGRKIKVERALLKNHAEQPQRGAWLSFDVVAANADPPRLDRKKAGHEREQRAFARAIEPKQRHEAAGLRRKRNSVECRAGAVAMAETVDRERRSFNRLAHCREIAMPHGKPPTAMVLMTFSVDASITDTSFVRPLVVSKYFSSGVKARCQTRWPTSRYFVT